VTGPWGIRGHLKVQPHTESAERFATGSSLYLDGTPVTVVSSRPHRVGYVVRLDTVPHRTAAESLRGALLTVPEDELTELPEGVFYHFQLIDMEVVTEEGEQLGRVAEILETPGNDVYLVRKSDTRDLLLPAIRDVVLDVDIDAGKVTVRLLPGLR
jgi:16S rRNA processing protein RimM